MGNLKHTKGEWFVELAAVQTEKRLIANCIGNGASITEENKANAKLIEYSKNPLLYDIVNEVNFELRK